MRTLIYSISMSLNSFIAGPRCDIGWSAPGAGRAHGLPQSSRRARSARTCSRRGPVTRTCCPGIPPRRTRPTLSTWSSPRCGGAFQGGVFSTTLRQVRGHARLASDDVASEVARLVEQPGEGVVSVGGAGLASTLIELDLIDEYRLFVHPVVLGGARRTSRPRTGRPGWSWRRPGRSTPGSSTFATGVDEALAVARLRAAGCVFAEEEATADPVSGPDPGELDAMVERRAGGLPLEQVIGWAEFCGLRIAVDPGVFVPRRRTQFLVRQAVASPGSPGTRPARSHRRRPVLRHGRDRRRDRRAVAGAELHAADIDPAAVRCARRNVPGPVYQGDLYAPLPPAAGPGRRPGRQRALRAHHRDPLAPAGGPGS